MDFDSYANPDAEELLNAARARGAQERAPRRLLVTEISAAAVFLALAVTLVLTAHAQRSWSATALIVGVVTYVAAARIVFPVGSAWTRPLQLAYVPMLFLLPVPWVPLVVCGCMLVDLAPQLIHRGGRVALVATRTADSMFSLGPAAVLMVFGAQGFAWRHWPVYALAFAVQVAVDLAAGLLRTWFAEGILPRQQTPMAWLYVTDACLSSAGLVVAAAAVSRPWVMILIVPQIGLLGLFARERSERMENTLALSTAYRGTAMLLGDVIEDDDEYTGIHSRQVVDLALGVAVRLGLDATQRRSVEFGALLHDVGKIRIPKEIIRKPGKLDDAEWAIMREHTIYGEEMLQQVGGTLSSVGKVVRHSHERYDGTGYPDGLAGQAIPIEARIVCACDAFNAMTTNRPYRPAMSLAEAIEELQRCSGTHFDPRVVYALLAEVAQRPPVAPAAARSVASAPGAGPRAISA